MGCGGSKVTFSVLDTPEDGNRIRSHPSNTSTVPPSAAVERRRSPCADKPASDEDKPAVLAVETNFSLKEVLSLKRLYKELSSTLHQDGLINKDEFQLALFKGQRNNYFAERVFQLFDMKQNSVIEFGEFVRSLSVFHPNAPLEQKAHFAFRLYDIGQTGYIDRTELKRFLLALMDDNPELAMDEIAMEEIIEQTFADAGVNNGKITPREWLQLVQANPGIITYMTLPVLGQLQAKYPEVA